MQLQARLATVRPIPEDAISIDLAVQGNGRGEALGH